VKGKKLDEVDNCCYMGSLMSNDCSLEKEIQSRIGKAANHFGNQDQK